MIEVPDWRRLAQAPPLAAHSTGVEQIPDSKGREPYRRCCVVEWLVERLGPEPTTAAEA